MFFPLARYFKILEFIELISIPKYMAFGFNFICSVHLGLSLSEIKRHSFS